MHAVGRFDGLERRIAGGTKLRDGAQARTAFPSVYPYLTSWVALAAVHCNLDIMTLRHANSAAGMQQVQKNCAIMSANEKIDGVRPPGPHPPAAVA